jgi:hypothetical protein
MSTLMSTLQQPLSLAGLAHCLGWVRGRASRRARSRSNRMMQGHGRRSPRNDLAAWVADGAPAAGIEGAADACVDDWAEGSRCGWFDSSHELTQGLMVVEHAQAQTVPADMQLNDWLCLVLEASPQEPLSTPQAGGPGIITS